jgi:hypothetical protein
LPSYVPIGGMHDLSQGKKFGGCVTSRAGLSGHLQHGKC